MNAQEPLVGVSAMPLPNDMYTWHGNIKGPPGTSYQNAVFHFQMVIPKDYPCSPPSITLYTPFPHPNVFGSTLCLDMFNTKSKEIYQGWVSAYSIESILIQLQSFLYESRHSYGGDAVQRAKNFKCLLCKHKGPLSPYPPFAKEVDADEFIQVKTPKELLKEELLCFHTKMPLKDGTLGVGITLKKNPRTGLLMYVNSTMDLMNMRSFTKLKIRRSLANERLTHWLPLYFGEDEIFTDESEHYDTKLEKMVTTKKTVNTKERFDRHVRQSLSFIANGSTAQPYNFESVL